MTLNDDQFDKLKNNDGIKECFQEKGIKRINVSQNMFERLHGNNIDGRSLARLLGNVYGLQIVHDNQNVLSL